MTDFEFPPLFKFRSLDKGSIKYTLKGIEDNEIWFADIDSLNDPFEMFYNIDSGVHEENIHEFFEIIHAAYNDRFAFSNLEAFTKTLDVNSILLLLDYIPKLSSSERALTVRLITENMAQTQELAIQRIKKDTKVFCCSTINSHPLLWGHYADGMRGICIEYDFNKQNQEPYFGFCNVNYQDLPLSINLLHFMKNNQVIDDYSEDIFGTKNIAWKYEREFRLLASNGHWKGNKLKLSDNVIKSITIGEFIAPNALDELLKSVSGKDIELKIALAKRESFSTEVIPYTRSFFTEKYK